MGRSPYLDQEPGGVLVLHLNKWIGTLYLFGCSGLLVVLIYYLYLTAEALLLNGKFNFSTLISVLFIIQLSVGLLCLIPGIIRFLARLITGGGGVVLDETGVWQLGIKGRRTVYLEWVKVESFYLRFHTVKSFLKIVKYKLYTDAIGSERFAFCQGPYENIGKAELVELLNRWREKFGGTSEAAS